MHNNAITCSWLCGLRGASTSNSLAQMEEKLRLGVEKIQETTGGLGTSKVRKGRQQLTLTLTLTLTPTLTLTRCARGDSRSSARPRCS